MKIPSNNHCDHELLSVIEFLTQKVANRCHKNEKKSETFIKQKLFQKLIEKVLKEEKKANKYSTEIIDAQTNEIYFTKKKKYEV